MVETTGSRWRDQLRSDNCLFTVCIYSTCIHRVLYILYGMMSGGEAPSGVPLDRCVDGEFHYFVL